MQRVMSRNGYSYVEGNPVNFADPSGRFPFALVVLVGLPILTALISSIIEVVHQYQQGQGGCLDWNQVAGAGAAGALGVVDAYTDILLSPIYAVRLLRGIVTGERAETPSQIKLRLLQGLGLDDEYQRLLNSLYFNVGQTVGDVGMLFISVTSYFRLLNTLSAGGGAAQLALSNGGTLSLSLVASGTGQITVAVAGAAGIAGQVVLMVAHSNDGGGGGGRRGQPAVGTQTGDTGRNARILADNLGPRPGNAQAHHIVPSTHERAYEARTILERFGIDINDAANGVYLPPEIHNGLANNYTYMDTVAELLSDATSRQQVEGILGRIGEQLLAGSFPR